MFSLSQALWKTLHNPDDSVAGVAYRVLGKFGGSNRKMLSTPQPVSTHVLYSVICICTCIVLGTKCGSHHPQIVHTILRLLTPSSDCFTPTSDPISFVRSIQRLPKPAVFYINTVVIECLK